MKHPSAKNQRVLAFDPYSNGFGFAVLEGPKRLIDYGVKKVKGDKNSACIRKIAGLIEHYQPEVIVLEDSTSTGSRRCQRVQGLMQEISRLASSKKIKARSFSRVQIRKAVPASATSTKHQIARSITVLLPELAFRLPPPRKPWMTEDERMSIFDAVALALVYMSK
jgi:Holliday junction resolvasome RuvABC endonuclease subunit